jgi:uncharacterized membrane protein YphA (DoxX/SURF4 family)
LTSQAIIPRVLKIVIAFVWLINGLFCKVLNFVPRHQEIVARILGDTHAPLLTKLIGFSEILMCLWIVSRIKSRWCALTQIAIVATMNTIEFVFAKDLLLFGSLNALFALLFCCVVFATEFVLARKEE